MQQKVVVYRRDFLGVPKSLDCPPLLGGGDFSVSQSNLEPVKQSIAGQEEHHRKIGFQDELRALLRKHETEWDGKYVWE